MSVFRSFIAIDLSSEIHRRLEQVSTDLQESMEGLPIRWVPVDNVHLTLKFLGDVSVANIEMLKKIIQTAATAHKEFEMSIGGAGAFPSSRRPRVVWIGIEAPPELALIQRSIDVETARLGYKSDAREFAPHLTLGRVSRSAQPREVQQISRVLEKLTLGFLGVTRVQAIHLYRSDLKPGGAVYSRLYSAPLFQPE